MATAPKILLHILASGLLPTIPGLTVCVIEGSTPKQRRSLNMHASRNVEGLIVQVL